jgi:two-component system sensor histidine kinase KdpD
VPFSAEQRRELLRTILEESERLNRLVGNLMDLSRLRAGVLNPSVESVLLEDLCWSVVQRLRPQLGDRQVRVHVREDVVPIPVDVVQMDQVLTNILENAIRYSPTGTAIGIAAVRWERAVELRVSDRGPGIPSEEREKVFREFYRRDVDGRRGGSGLGLTIAQAIVSAHGGSMWIEDTPGGGTTIGMRLPLGRPAPDEPPQEPPAGVPK